MAVVRVAAASRLAVKVQTGVSASGSPVFRVRNFQNMKPSAAEADVFAVGQALAGLQKHPVNSIGRVDEGELMEE